MHISGGGLRLLLKNSMLSLALKAFSTIMALAVNVILARQLGPADYGIYALALSVALLLGFPAHVGIPKLLVREVALYHARAQWNYLRGIIRRARQAVVLLSLVVCAAAGTTLLLLDIPGGEAYLLALVLVPVFALLRLSEAIARGLHRPISAQVPEMLVRSPVNLMLVGVVGVVGQLSAVGAVAAYAVATTAAAWMAGVLAKSAVRQETVVATPSFETREWAKAVVPFALLGGITLINTRIDLLMLGLLADTQEAGLYRVALQLSTLVAFALSAVSALLAPQISRLYHTGQRTELQRMLTWGARIVAAVGVPTVLGMFFFGETILTMLFGREYLGSHSALVILCAGQLVNALTGSIGLLINMTGHERVAVRTLTVTAAANIVLNMLLIPTMGGAGAAVATAVSLASFNAYLSYHAWRFMRLDATVIGAGPR
ncbi:oligosaccharide flippase family protein [Pelagibacterium halotolerans]|uniref:Uncharacterized protein n=1 Tax=Pelagibacterium halotolerans (strain DSM 22347 / JCM 15775 / CGMCC 1.7692 / B2) TaxID=1082931 RepID=G4RGZ2_PELHB|nr:oligosaccharide flippase family protein [Pelagibacterium halotolerans]AEQ53145.1 hypothetical protein KKY_3155 [Pelagibacterium halotolerans B2]QJR17213.1 oligosaccharide flippase family protein [Pelagibacterium halotolerans]SEA88929.1 Membrane protein involved in the export of O-antigen and teichoic acid [Pelagibacterium halotolerans]